MKRGVNHKADYSPAYCVKVKNEWSYVCIYTPSIHLHELYTDLAFKILVQSSHLHLGFPSFILPTKTLYIFIPSPYVLHAPPIFISSFWHIWWAAATDHASPRYAVVPRPIIPSLNTVLITYTVKTTNTLILKLYFLHKFLITPKWRRLPYINLPWCFYNGVYSSPVGR
jgi:hypothetical protein